MTRRIILICISFLLLYGTASSCKKISAEETSKMDPTVQKEAKVATRQMLSLWLSEGIEGVQFLRTSKWKIDEQVFLNSSKDKGYLLLLNQAKDPLATVDYVQVLYASKDEGKGNIYLESLPNLVIPGKTENGSFVATTLEQLATAGEKEIGRQYKNGDGDINDEFINQRFLARKIKN